MDSLPSMAIILVLVALCWAIVLLQKVTRDHSRFLVGMIGLMATFHGLRQLKYLNVTPPEMLRISDQVADVLVAVLLLIALVILDGEVVSHQSAKIQLRLSQALEPPALTLGEKALVHAMGALSREGGGRKSHQDAVIKRLVNTAPVAILGFSRHRRVIFGNAAAAQLFGCGADELVGKDLAALTAAVDPAKSSPTTVGRTGPRVEAES